MNNHATTSQQALKYVTTATRHSISDKHKHTFQLATPRPLTKLSLLRRVTSSCSNLSTSYVGAVYLGTQSYMEVNNSTITNNQAGYGAFEVESESILNIAFCNLTHNFAYKGAVYTHLANLVRVANSILNENHAINTGIGGALATC